MSTVRLRHPGLPDDQIITAPEQAASHWRAAGWEPVEEPEPETTSGFAEAKAAAESDRTSSPAPATAADAASEPAPDTPADAVPESTPDTAPRRRATKEAEK